MASINLDHEKKENDPDPSAPAPHLLIYRPARLQLIPLTRAVVHTYRNSTKRWLQHKTKRPTEQKYY